MTLRKVFMACLIGAAFALVMMTLTHLLINPNGRDWDQEMVEMGSWLRGIGVPFAVILGIDGVLDFLDGRR